MNIKMTIKDVCAHIPQVELEENFDIKDIERVLDSVKKVASNLADGRGPHATPNHNRPMAESNRMTATSMRLESAPISAEKDFIPASEQALKALYAAAMSNGSSVERVCREFGVDPAHISKTECWEMTTELNQKSGYDRTRQASQGVNYPKAPYPRADKYPDDSDVFGNQ